MVTASHLLQERGAAEGLCVVGASAGSGKTYHLTRVVLDALGDPGAALDVESLVAVTYTTRAATELRSRIRQELVRRGATENALRLPLARLGTVHAVCLSWVEDYAIDAGLPPGVRVLPDDGGLQFRLLLEAHIPTDLQARMSALGQRLNTQVGQREPAQRLALAGHRNHRARPRQPHNAGCLPGDGRALDRCMAELLPTPGTRDLDAALEGALDRAIEDVENAADRTKSTQGVLKEMKATRWAFWDKRATWKDWAALAALEPAKNSQPLVQNLRNIAADCEAHPRFQSELREMITGVFESARLGLERYQGWKERLRLVDYVDMLERALGLLDRPEVARDLAERLGMVVVDEFQDTSPIQLELFLRLHQLTRRSTWVGDRKQCIFEFAGADPQLMDSVTRWVADNGGSSQQLPHNYRSRPELVALCSELFSQALAPHGFTRDEVAVSPRRPAPPELAGLPPLGIFSLATSNAEQQAAALARGVQRLLAAPAETPIVDRHTGHVRPLQPGDIAILVRTNAEAESVAGELSQLRIRPALARPGLLRTPEGTLLDAALSYLVDRNDGVASATLDALHGFGGEAPDRWLEEQIRACHARRDAAAAREAAARDAAARNEASREAPGAPIAPANDTASEHPLHGWRAALAPLADKCSELSPRETVDALLALLDLHRLVLAWPDPEQRAGNIDALRALAGHYEDTCRVTGAAASLAGLLHYFDRAREPRWDGNEMRANDEQHFSQGPGAVVLCTYHRSKGLEWPVVILASLDAGPRADAFGVKIQAPEDPLDPERPLQGRWLRYLPRPVSGRSRNLGFVTREQQSAAGLQARLDERNERARLLYVGFTRARDHLILAARNRKGGLETQWLDELCDATGTSLLRLPVVGNAELASIAVAGTAVRVQARVWAIDPVAASATPVNDTTQMLTWRRPAPVAAREVYAIAPSNATEPAGRWPVLTVGSAVRIGPPLVLQGAGDVDWAAFGDTVHGFLAADRRHETAPERLERARRLLEACRSGARLPPESLLETGDALAAFVAARWPGAVWHREVPVRVRMGSQGAEQRLSGSIDLLLETEGGFVVIDHKTFGNPTQAAVLERARQYLPQLAAYGAAMGALGGKPVVEYWLHFGVAGMCVQCHPGQQEAR